MRLALAQINTTVGDIAGNTAKIIDYVRRARADGADVVAFPELAICGYPPEDLLLKPSFLRQCETALGEIVAASQDIVVVVGYPEAADAVYNAAAVICDGRVAAICRKERLPNYGVFDEQRYFRPQLFSGLLHSGHPGQSCFYRCSRSICLGHQPEQWENNLAYERRRIARIHWNFGRWKYDLWKKHAG